MALESNDIAMLHSMGFSPYEQVKIGYMQDKSRTSGIGIAGLAVGIGAGIAAVGGWLWAGSQSKAAKDLAIAKNDGLRDLVTTLASTVAAERNERINGDFTLNQTITDTVSGQQASTLTAQQAAELSAVNSVMQQTYSDFVTGRASLNPTPVSLYSSPKPCDCPYSGCGCNG